MNTAKTVMDINNESVTCPLNFPHQILCPSNCNCVRRSFDEVLIVACSNISTVPALPPYRNLKDFPLSRIQLVVKGNEISFLPSKAKDVYYNDVTEIFAAYNKIREISIENIPDRLQFLDIQFNRIKSVSVDVIMMFASLSYLQISNNPWNCTNEGTLELVKFVKEHRSIVRDFNAVQCLSQQYFLEIDVHAGCHKETLIAIALFLIFAITWLSIYIYHFKREAISEWIFTHDKHHIVEAIANKFKLFDGLIIATEYDKIFARYLTAKLMDKPNRYKMGSIMRDWSPDDPIPKNVLQGMRNSKRAIVVLSDYFEESDWTRWNHFNTGTRIIFVSRGKVAPVDFGISNQISIRFSDPWFWDKLKHAMENVEELSFEEDAFEMQEV